jgi:3-isopropylmalate/(R)-2-methylmalate dehydratase small subunit
MQPFTRLTGIAAPMPRDNVDTDAIIPSRESSSVSRDGYGEKLFANWRYQPGTRIENPTFVLNEPRFRHACALVAGYNFGCGSSREAAVWSLTQFGIRCVIAKTFGEIFRKNCISNGLLPIILEPAAVDTLVDWVSSHAEPIDIDLVGCRVSAPCGSWDFSLDPLDRDMLLEGLNAIDLTLKFREQITDFQAGDMRARPWIYERNDRQADPTTDSAEL